MIEVRNLVKKYGNHLAVDHLDFRLESGKVYGFLGPNGGGKIHHNEYYDRISGRYGRPGDY